MTLKALLPRLRPVPPRLSKRKVVTIGIGFHCKDGIVLASDQQQTVEGYFKTHSTKLGNLIYGGATILWTYSYLPNLVTVMKDGLFSKLPRFPPDLTPDQVGDAISQEIVEMKSLYPEEMKTQQFLFAYSCGKGVRFIRAAHGIVDEPTHAYIGIGDSSLINYIFGEFCAAPVPLLSIEDASFLAIYMVYCAKQFVDGCGGVTDVVVLRAGDGHPHFVPTRWIRDIETQCGTHMQDIFRHVYSILTARDISKDDLAQTLVILGNSIKAFRQRMRNLLSGQFLES